MRASRYLDTSVDFDGPDYETALVEGLLRVAREERDRSVLFPVSDRDMIAVSSARDVLSPHFRLLLPPHERARASSDPPSDADEVDPGPRLVRRARHLTETLEKLAPEGYQPS